jgi:alpha-L-rhamnosidase
MKFLPSLLLFILFLTGSALHAAPSLRIDRLSCEDHSENILGVETPAPRFSWTMTGNGQGAMQRAYEIIVSDNLADIKASKGNVWKSGKVLSDQSLHVVYAGKDLKPFTRYYWRLRVYDGKDKCSSWSKIVWFETAMLSQKDWSAKWIGDGSAVPQKDEDFYKDQPSPVFKKDFRAGDKLRSARLYISGLGYYEAYLNGRKVGDRVLEPGWTAHAKEVLYSVYDVSTELNNGPNTIRVMLGNGFYNPLPLRLFSKHNIRDEQQTGQPCLKAELHLNYESGRREIVPSDESWLTAPGPVIRNSAYLGEHYDARVEMLGWKSAVLADGPSGRLSVQMQPPVRITKEIKPIDIKEVKQGVFVVDMGQNFAGAIRLKVQGKAGETVVLRYGEDVYKDGSINVMTTVTGQIKRGNGGPGAPKIAWQEDRYTLKGGDTEVWQPHFTFHGFRYVEVTGWPGKPTVDDFVGLRMNADLERNGSFSCSNPMFNRLKEIIDYTFLSNVFSVQSDCPAREKLGYGGDIVATAESFIYNYDMASFYKKAIQDFKNDQRKNGGFTETAPYIGIQSKGLGGGSGPLGWQLAYPILLKQLYDFYGDAGVIADGYDALKTQVEFVRGKAVGHLFEQDISDHESLDEKPEALTASLFYYHHILLIAEFAGILGKMDDQAKYAALGGEIRQAIDRKFKRGGGLYDNATQAAQLFALYYGLPGAELKASVLQKLEAAFAAKDWHVSTGIFSTKMLFDVLRDNDLNEWVYKIANQRDFPGWGHMVEQGATTLWETWKYSDNTYSQNHPMFGSVNEWFYRSLLGINLTEAGFKRFRIKPQPAGDLTWAKGSYESVRGTISSSWKIEKGTFKMEVGVPANTMAEIWVPLLGKPILNKGEANRIKTRPGLRHLRSVDGYEVYEAAPGTYRL